MHLFVLFLLFVHRDSVAINSIYRARIFLARLDKMCLTDRPLPAERDVSWNRDGMRFWKNVIVS